MSITLDGTNGITTPDVTSSGALNVNASAPDNSLVVNSSGNVGVGTTSPNVAGVSKALTVNTTNGSSGAIYELAVNGANYAYLFANASNTVLSSVQNLPLTFATNNTERARIDSSGNLLIGTTSQFASSRLSIVSGGNGFVVSVANGAVGSYMTNTSGTTAWQPFSFNNNGTSFSQIGSITCSSTTTSYNTSSDYRLKNTIAPMTGALAKVQQLKPVTYKWNADGSDGEGFIAHELAEVCPQAVTGEKDAVDADGNPVYQGIDTSFLVATLTAAIQEQQATITSLTARVEALEANNV